MPVSQSFFINTTTTNAVSFGLCDDPPPPSKPAYVDKTDRSKWIAIVSNPASKPVLFAAIDNQIELKRQDGTKDNSCDALLAHEKTVIFVELKQREYSGWIASGYEQLKSTIAHFSRTVESASFTKKKAYIANSLRPNAEYGKMGIMEQFAKETGYVLRIRNTIEIE